MNAPFSPVDLAYEEGSRIGERLFALADEVGAPNSVTPALAIATEALRHIEAVVGWRAAFVAACTLVSGFRRRLVNSTPRHARPPIPFTLTRVEARSEGFAMVCRTAAGIVDEYVFSNAEGTAEAANLIKLLGSPLSFGRGTDAVRYLLTTRSGAQS